MRQQHYLGFTSSGFEFSLFSHFRYFLISLRYFLILIFQYTVYISGLQIPIFKHTYSSNLNKEGKQMGCTSECLAAVAPYDGLVKADAKRPGYTIHLKYRAGGENEHKHTHTQNTLTIC